MLAGSDSGAVAAASAAAAGTAAGGQAEADAEAEVEPALRSPDSQVPRLLRQSAAWSWRLLLTGLVIYLAFRLAEHLRLVVLPFIAALLLSALLQPLAAWLRRRGMSDLASTWCAFGLMIVVIGGAGWLVVTQISDTYPVLFSEVQKTADQLQRSLAGPPFHLNATRLSKLSTDVLNYISQHKSRRRRHRADRRQVRAGVPGRDCADPVHQLLPDQGRPPDLAVPDQRDAAGGQAARGQRG